VPENRFYVAGKKDITFGTDREHKMVCVGSIKAYLLERDRYWMMLDKRITNGGIEIVVGLHAEDLIIFNELHLLEETVDNLKAPAIALDVGNRIELSYFPPRNLRLTVRSFFRRVSTFSKHVKSQSF
jgi:hypothetical protein